MGVNWNLQMALWYNDALKYSNYPQKVLEVIRPIIKDCKTLLDIGAGVGALSIPLAKTIKKITVLDPSPSMLRVLREEAAKKKIKNINYVNSTWEDSILDNHDVIIAANIPSSLVDSSSFIWQINNLSNKFVFLILGVDPNKDRFYFKELYPLVFKQQYYPKPDYLKNYIALYQMGIYANIELIEYDFDQRFVNIEEALEFWKAHLQLDTDKYDKIIKEFLENKLITQENNLIAKIHRKSAIIWWQPQK